MKTPTADGEAEEEEVVASERSEGKKLKQKRRMTRRTKTNTWIHISQGILKPSTVSSSPRSNMGRRREAAVDMSEIRFYCLSETSTNYPLCFAWPCFLTLEKS
ncbi:hypothetical protein H0E87_010142 [Populus deltoides]|uniref:Uncharacterized protein n=1 Tax=Populus deltoides TaxID=3696 RepID=A0A8T2YRY3_POPDE|nr:hypothetical protein H0E87_010142 [Populus deltoides]